MDELFLLPTTPVAMPRSYWLDTPHKLTSAVLLAEPSVYETNRISSTIAAAGPRDFDMEVLNTLYNKSAMVLPHRPYMLVSGEFRHARSEHAAWLGNDDETWDAGRTLKEAKFVHFSDWPMPKPWVTAPKSYVEETQPQCFLEESGKENCRDREVWLDFYEDFRERRQVRY
jgi:hypothetical protein